MTRTQDWVAAYHALLCGAVARSCKHFRSPWLLQSGGKDSTTLAIAAAEVRPDTTCITYLGGSEENEVSSARSVAETLGLRHETLVCDPARGYDRYLAIVGRMPLLTADFALAVVHRPRDDDRRRGRRWRHRRAGIGQLFRAAAGVAAPRPVRDGEEFASPPLCGRTARDRPKFRTLLLAVDACRWIRWSGSFRVRGSPTARSMHCLAVRCRGNPGRDCRCSARNWRRQRAWRNGGRWPRRLRAPPGPSARGLFTGNALSLARGLSLLRPHAARVGAP